MNKTLTIYRVLIFCLIAFLGAIAAAQQADSGLSSDVAERDRLATQALTLAREGKYDEATALFERVYTIEEACFGPNHRELVGTLSLLGQIAELKQDDKAIVEIRIRQNRLAQSLYGESDYRAQDASRAVSEAEQDASRSIEDRQRLDEAREVYAEAVELYQSQDYDAAAAKMSQSSEIFRQVLGDQHQRYGDVLGWLAGIVEAKGDQEQAESLYRRVTEIRRAELGQQHPIYASSLSSLAGFYRSINDAAQAEQLYRQALQIKKQVFGDRSAEYAMNMYSLALLLSEKGDDTEQLYRQVMDIQKEILGENDLDYLNTLNSLAEFYGSRGDHDKAEPLLQQAVKIKKKIFGEQHPEHAASLMILASLHLVQNEYPKAEPLLRQAMQIRKSVLGEQHPEYIESLNHLAAVYCWTENHAKAEPLLDQLVKVQKKVLGEQHPEYVDSLFALGMCCYKAGNAAKAEPLLRQVLSVEKRVFGEQSADYASRLSALGVLYGELRDYDLALPTLRRAMAIQKQLNREQHPAYATSLHNLAVFQQSMGDYVQAEASELRALAIRKRVSGEQSLDYAASLDGLALTHELLGRYADAKPLYRQAMAIRKKALGESHPDYAQSLNHLSVLHALMRDFDQAATLQRQALMIRKQSLGELHPKYAESLGNLAWIYQTLGDYDQAEQLLHQAEMIEKQSLGEQHHSYAMTLQRLASLYLSKGDSTKAAESLRQALVIRKKTVGEMHPDYAMNLSGLANIYHARRDYQKAEPLYLQVMEIHKRTIGVQHSDYAANLNNLAILYESNKEFGRAEKLYVDAFDGVTNHLATTASGLSEQQQLKMSRTLKLLLRNSIRCGLKMDPQPETLLERVVASKGAISVRLRNSRLVSDDPSIAHVHEKLRSQTQQLAALSNGVPGPDRIDDWKAKVTELTQQREDTEADLMRQSSVFRDAMKRPSYDDLREAIPTDSVIVDYFEYGDIDDRSLVATIVRPTSPLVMVDLGSSNKVRVAIETWRYTLGVGSKAMAAGQQLRDQLWKPLLPYIEESRLIFVSPDGMLGQMPFNALPGKEQGDYLIEDHAIVMLPVPMLLPAMMQRDGEGTGFLSSVASDTAAGLLMGAVDYDSVDTSSSVEPPTESDRPSLLASRSGNQTRGNAKFNALKGTGPEIDAIERLFRDSRAGNDSKLVRLRGRGATETQFRRAAKKARWLHLATHGFFAPEDKKNALAAAEVDRSKMALGMIDTGAENREGFVGFSPGQLSGLVFAGANRPPQPIDPLSLPEVIDDGIMTADEIANMRLQNVELAVLSACETGLGQVAGGEGIIGLQRGLQIAGVGTTVTSLWQVDDAATRVLMIEFYRNLLERKLGKLESLRQAQIWLINHPEAIDGRDLSTRAISSRGAIRLGVSTTSQDDPSVGNRRSLPAYWAAFQMAGDPR